MKKFFFLLLLLPPFALGSCDDDESRFETWTVASEKGVTGIVMGYGYAPAYIVKTNPNAEWEISSAHIDGFTFEKGYETEMLVRIDPIPNPPADGSSVRYRMVQLISRKRTQSVDPEAFSPKFEIVVASERGSYNDRPYYWFKDTRYPDPQWNPFPWEIDGFGFTPGYECRLRVKVSAQYDDAAMRYGVKYTLTEELSREKKDSEGLPDKE